MSVHVVILGGGFGGLSAARALARAPVRVTLLDRHNYHLFQPLLYQVATASLSPADVASPIRWVLRRQKNVEVLLAEAQSIDPVRRVVALDAGPVPAGSAGRSIAFDYLILATGSSHSYFGHDDWAASAPGLKTLDDALKMRQRILLAFEAAERAAGTDEQPRLLTFVIVGGGPTGVELAGALAEIARQSLRKDFRRIRPESARIVLLEGSPHLLGAFPEPLRRAAQRSLEQLGVEVRLGTAVSALDESGVTLGAERIEARTVIWGAGVTASPAGRWLAADTDRAGRVKVTPDLSVPGQTDIFVIGDTAAASGTDGKPLPGVAPVAKQQGEYVARLLIAREKGDALPPFRYRDFGSLATIGRKRAVIQMGRVQLHGFIAWLIWCVAHIYFLIGFRNRLVVAMNWLWNYLTFQRGTRLITGMEGANARDIALPADEKRVLQQAS